jgi:hypothetical protein
MTKTSIVSALPLILSLAIASPAQAWPEQSSSIGCAWGGDPTECEALTVALVHKHALAHPHGRKTEHAATPLASSHLPDRGDDPLASMHFE